LSAVRLQPVTLDIGGQRLVDTDPVAFDFNPISRREGVEISVLESDTVDPAEGHVTHSQWGLGGGDIHGQEVMDNVRSSGRRHDAGRRMRGQLHIAITSRVRRGERACRVRRGERCGFG
jgi:hypothetical protein